MAPNLVIEGSNRSAIPTQRNGVNILEESYKGNMGANESETTVDIIPAWPYRSFDFTLTASSWGTATATIKIYPCDSDGTIDGTNTNAFFSVALSGNGTTRLFLAEMGGAVSAATYPPTAQTTGSVIGTFGNSVKITETVTGFSSGTNTVRVKVRAKG